MGKLRCPDCNYTQIHFRMKTNDFACSKCGKISKKEDLKK